MFTPVVLALLLSIGPSAQAGAQKPPAVRTIDIVGTDEMKFDVTTIAAKPGEQLRIRLKSVGTIPKIVMAHNVVVLKLGVDPKAFNSAAAMARATDFIPPARKGDVVAATGLAGPGETVEVTFKVPAKAGSYPFICSFPGHFNAGMLGTLAVK